MSAISMNPFRRLRHGYDEYAHVAKQNWGILLSSMLMGFGTWGVDHVAEVVADESTVDAWLVLLHPRHVCSLLGITGAVLLGYFGGRTPKR